jgi:hypothetical protein
MNTYDFEFGTASIELHSKKDLKEQLLSELRKNVQFIRYDFNKNIHSSSAYRFNTAPVGSPFLVSIEFIDFLLANSEETEASEYVLVPFYSNSDSVINPIRSNFTVDNNTLIKHSEIFLDTGVLIQAYVVDFIFEKCLSENVKNFSVKSQSYARSNGKTDYEIAFSIEDDINFTAPTGNTAYCLHHNEEENPDNKISRFANSDIGIDCVYVITNAPTCMRAKSLATILSKNRSVSQFKSASTNFKKDIFVIDSNLEIHSFTPFSN